MRLVCISDTHSLEWKMTSEVPDGDILLHAGDIMNSGYDSTNIIDFCRWYSAFPHKHKIFIAGNHDRMFERNPELARGIVSNYPNITYLQDESVTVEGLKIYGSPWQPEFCNWAFNLDRGADLKRVWDKIPEDTDVLITHGPPMGILDLVQYDKIHVGCEELLPRIKKIKPMLHLFGHIHETYGVFVEDETTYVNASICTLRYDPINKPIVFDYHPEIKSLIEII